MWETDLKKHLDDAGNISRHQNEAFLEMALYLTEIIALVTNQPPKTSHSLDYMCYRGGCEGKINSQWHDGKVSWRCSKCQTGGAITNWQLTHWDSRK